MERQLSTKRLYEGRILNLRVDEVEVSKNKSHARREVVEHRPAVAILARDEQGRFLAVRQFRYPVTEDLLEIPAGLMESGEDPLTTAKRELREETGYSADSWKTLTSVYSAPGFSNERLYLFAAWGLHWSPLKQDEDEDIQLVRLTLEEVKRLYLSGHTQDAKSLAAFGWAFAFPDEFKSY